MTDLFDVAADDLAPPEDPRRGGGSSSDAPKGATTSSVNRALLAELGAELRSACSAVGGVRPRRATRPATRAGVRASTHRQDSIRSPIDERRWTRLHDDRLAPQITDYLLRPASAARRTTRDGAWGSSWRVLLGPCSSCSASVGSSTSCPSPPDSIRRRGGARRRDGGLGLLFQLVKGTEVAVGALLLANRFVPWR